MSDAGAVDGGGGGSDAGLTDAGRDAGDPCATASATIGAAGGSLELCGARLDVAAGALEAPIEVRIERIDVAGPGEPFEIIGSVYRFSPAAIPATIALPHLDHAIDAELLRHDGAQWVAVGACEDDGTHLVQTLGALGTFALSRDARSIPTSPDRRGGVKLDLSLDGTTYRFASGDLGHAGLSLRYDGTEELRLQGHDDEGRVLVVSLEIDEAGELRVTDVAFASAGNGNFVWVLAYEGMVPMEGEIAPEGRHLIGALEGKLVDEAGGHHDVTIAIDAVAQPFRELPERVCP